jgi:hypothetical protein
MQSCEGSCFQKLKITEIMATIDDKDPKLVTESRTSQSDDDALPDWTEAEEKALVRK